LCFHAGSVPLKFAPRCSSLVKSCAFFAGQTEAVSSRAIFAQPNASGGEPAPRIQNIVDPGTTYFMEYLIVFTVASFVGLFTLLIRHWLRGA